MSYMHIKDFFSSHFKCICRHVDGHLISDSHLSLWMSLDHAKLSSINSPKTHANKTKKGQEEEEEEEVWVEQRTHIGCTKSSMPPIWFQFKTFLYQLYKNMNFTSYEHCIRNWYYGWIQFVCRLSLFYVACKRISNLWSGCRFFGKQMFCINAILMKYPHIRMRICYDLNIWLKWLIDDSQHRRLTDLFLLLALTLHWNTQLD